MFATHFQTTESSSVFCSLLFHVNKVVQKDLYTPLQYNFSFITSNHVQNSVRASSKDHSKSKQNYSSKIKSKYLKKEKKEQKT